MGFGGIKCLAGSQRNHKVLLGLLLILLGAYRFCLSWSGQLYWPDEYRYLHALHVLDELRKGDVSRAVYWVFGSESGVASRPSYILVSLAPALVQGLANMVLGVQPTDPSFYRIPAAGNVLVSLGLTLVLYRIAFLLTGDRLLALLGAAVHGLLANTNMYVRHLLPYDASLLLFLASVMALLEQADSPSRTWLQAGLAGLLSGTAATTYPGYYLFLIIPLALLLAKRPLAWRPLALFIAAALAVAVLWEATARFAGFSFVEASQRFSTTLTPESLAGVQGAHEEGFFFLALYLVEVEGLAGLVLGALFLVFGALAIQGRFSRTQTAMILAAVVAYLVYAVAVQALHRAVFYGRLVHMYLPFVVLAAVLVIRELKAPSFRYGAAMVMLVVSFLSLVPAAVSALTLRFPKDLERELKVVQAGARICSVGQGRDQPADGSVADCDVVIENGRHLYPLPEQWRSVPPAGFVLVAEYRHPMQFRPYWFEGYKPQERERLRADPPNISVFRRSGYGAWQGPMNAAEWRTEGAPFAGDHGSHSSRSDRQRGRA